MKVSHLCCGALVVSAWSVSGCERERQRTEPGEPTSTAREEATRTAREEIQPVGGTTTSAATDIAQARCAREMRCNNVGAGKEYASEQACLTRVQADWREELNARECPAGINRTELNECLQEIRNASCDNPIESLGSFLACRQSDICESMR